MAWIEYKGFDESVFHLAPWVWCLIAIYLSIPILFYMVIPSFVSSYHRRLYVNDTQAVVCVLGDLGHSPRMCYHARSLSDHGFNVRLCGYFESEISSDLTDDNDIDLYEINVLQNFGLPYLIFALVKVIRQCFTLFTLLFDVMQDSKYIIIQNPPSLPLLMIVVILQKFWYRNCRLIIDWHNLNFSILNLKFQNEAHPVVKLMKWYEQYFGKFANINLTVTKEMGKYLINEFGLSKSKVITLYDRAPEQFQPVDSETKLQFIESNPDIFQRHNTNFKFNPEKDRILISSTSFTADEDFSILLQALKLYDAQKQLPNILLIVTGKGPLKEQFLNDVSGANFEKIIVHVVWTSIETYPKLIAVADLGVSLHTSSSGMDLPMKIVDLFGCGIPVISLKFNSIGELVKDGVNGIIVQDSTEMFESIQKLFGNDKLLQELHKGARLETKVRWNDMWNDSLGRII